MFLDYIFISSQVPCKLGDHYRRSLGLLWAFCGSYVSNICASIMMLQKVAAMVNKVAADLRFRACKVRWLLMKIFFAIAASSAAIFCVPLYNIVMPYLRHFGSFAPKIGDFERKIGANDMRKLLYYNNFRVSVFF